MNILKKILIVGKCAEVTKGELKGCSGVIIKYNLLSGEVEIYIDEFGKITTHAEYVKQGENQ